MAGNKTILITSVGSQVGSGILDSLAGRRAGLRIVGTNSRAEAPAVYACDSAYLVPELSNDGRLMDAFLEILDKERPDLIVPGRDDDIPFLANLPGLANNHALSALTGPLWLADTLRDKHELALYAARHGLPFVETVPSERLASRTEAQAIARQFGWPLVIKPAKGDGSRDIWLVKDDMELAAWGDTPGFVVQPYLGTDAELIGWLQSFQRGTPLHSSAPQVTQDVVQVLIGRLGGIVGSFGMRTEMRAGRSWRVIANPDPALLAVGSAFGAQLARDGWRGPLNIQTRLAGGRYIPFEVNGRFNGTSSARTALGFDEVGLILKDYLDFDFDLEPAPPSDTTVVLRQLVDKPLSAATLAGFQREGIWRGSDGE